VVWTNTDTMVHNVTSTNGMFSSGAMQPGQQYSLSFNAPGVYSYRCTLHPGMTGTITVLAPSSAPPSQVPQGAATQLGDQAQALLLRVQQLRQQLAAAQGNVNTGVTIDSSSCPQIGRSLRRGSSGDDVRRLQQFLARDTSIYPEGSVTGHYGALTEAAVKRWQAKYHVVSSGSAGVTGYGVVGPRTAAAIAILCSTGSYNGVAGPGGSVGGFIQVTPVSGNAPLKVSVQAVVNTVRSCNGATYILDWGDGTGLQHIVQQVGNCAQQTQTFEHTYRQNGTYNVVLSSGAHRTGATVQVGGGSDSSTSDNMRASPRSGDSPLEVEFTGTINSSESCDGGTYTLDFGDGESTSIRYPADSCTAYTFEREHTYTSSGTYSARLYKGSSSGTRVDTDIRSLWCAALKQIPRRYQYRRNENASSRACRNFPDFSFRSALRVRSK
jgi:plastocyanin